MLTIQDIQLDASKHTVLMDGAVGVASVSPPRAEESEPKEGEEGVEVEAEEGAPGEPEVIREKKQEEVVE